jgi:hypothetical protein
MDIVQNFNGYTNTPGEHGREVFRALCHEPEGRGFETSWNEWMFSIYLILTAALGPEVHSASNNMSTRNWKIMKFLRSKARAVCRADNLDAICEPII